MSPTSMAMLDALAEPALLVEAASRRVVAVSRAGCRRYGIEASAWRGVPLGDIVRCAASDLSRMEGIFDGAESPQSMPMRVSGGRGEVEELATLARFEDGGRVYALCTFAPGPPRNSAPEEIYSRLRELYELSNDVIYATDTEGRLTSINPAGLQLFGVEAGEILGQPITRYVEAEELRGALDRHRAVYDAGKPTPNFEVRCRTRAGAPVWLEVSAMKLVAGGCERGVLGMGRNITERKRAEQALLDSQQRLEQQKTILSRVIEQNPYAIALWKPDGELRQCNDAFVKLIGTVPGAGYNILRDRQAVEMGLRELFDRALAGETIFVERAQYDIGRNPALEAPSKPVNFSLILFPVVDARDRPILMVTIFQDLARELEEKAAREMLEAQLRQAQKMEAIGTLAGGIAHDFNNLLTGVLGYLDIIRASSGPELHGYIGKAEKAAHRACELTRQLLAYARKTRMEAIAHDMNHTLGEVAALIEKTIDPRIAIEIIPSAEPATVLADPGQMNQVLMNLCINARDAVRERIEAGAASNGWHPRIRVRVRRYFVTPGHRKKNPEAREGWFMRLSVNDTGTGMDEPTRARIFDPFFTTKPVGSGTGLGLATIFGIVTQHGGWIEVFSEPGMGSIFRVYLPLVEAEPVAPSEAAVSVRVKGGDETILLVDDEEMIRDLGKDILQEKGYTVLLARDGEEALRVYTDRHDEIDLVLLDLAMPRLSGPEVLPRLREIDPGVRVIASSGYSSEDETRALLGGGAATFVEKPYHAFELLRAVRQVLDGEVHFPPGES